MRDTNSNNNTEEDLIDYISLIKKNWLNRRLIIKSTIIFFTIGCLVAINSPVVYKSETTFVPQTSDNNSSTVKDLGSLASLAGINLSGETSSSLDNYISPLLYARIFESEEFSLDLINENLVFLNGDTLTIKEYLTLDSDKFSLIGFISKYTIGLFSSNDRDKDVDSEISKNYNFISQKDYNLINRIKKNIEIELNEKEGFIKVIARDKNPFVSTQIVKLVTKNLQSKIISLRTNKIKEQVDYSKLQYEKQQNLFEDLQNNLAEFKDSNKNISTAVFMSELQKLESEYQLQSNILIRLAGEFNNNKIKLNKDTPIFSVLDEVSVPNEKDSNKMLIIFIYILLGIFSSVGYISIKDYFIEFVQKLK